MPAIVGVTFPVPKPLMSRFFAEGKTVFIKPATVFKELQSGMKLVFYQSREDTGYAGEATIRRIVISDDPIAFFETYGDAVFLTREEAPTSRARGAGGQEGRNEEAPLDGLELEDIREYSSIKKPERFVPVGGRYLRG